MKYTLKELRKWLRICEDLGRWYRFETAKLDWKRDCHLCHQADKVASNRLGVHASQVDPSDMCRHCLWTTFEACRCLARGASENRRRNRVAEWCARSTPRLDRWVKLLRQRIKYRERKPRKE